MAVWRRRVLTSHRAHMIAQICVHARNGTHNDDNDDGGGGDDDDDDDATHHAPRTTQALPRWQRHCRLFRPTRLFAMHCGHARSRKCACIPECLRARVRLHAFTRSPDRAWVSTVA